MAPKIQVQNPHKHRIDEERLIQAARTALGQHSSSSGASLCIVIADAELSRALNNRHRQIDEPADVLSFGAPALPDSLPTSERHLGDIVIAHELVAAHAAASAMDLADCLRLLVIHGTLHLLGYDHDSVASHGRMWAAQAEALASLGINPEIVDRYEQASLD